MKVSRFKGFSFDTLRLEGGLFLPDVLEKAAQGKASRQEAADYHVPRGITPQEQIGRSFRIAQAQWKVFSAALERNDLDPGSATHAFIEEFFRDVLGYAEYGGTEPVEIDGRFFPIAGFAAGNTPIVIAPHTLELDDPDTAFAPQGGGARRKSPFQLLQEFLNAEPDCRWGLAANGRRIRLARDAATLTRPSFLEFDLQAILGEARYPDFAALWRLLHGSRAGSTANTASAPAESVWDVWRADGQREGSRVREGLRLGVEAALKGLGAGFLQHPANEALRRALNDGNLNKKDYFEELLRLIYRFIFLFAVEDRGLLHPAGDGTAAALARKIYDEGYSARRLTYETLNDAAFQDAVRKAYPLVDFDKPFREFTAASGETQSENPMR